MSSHRIRGHATRRALSHAGRRAVFPLVLAILAIFGLAAAGGSAFAQTAPAADAQPAAPGAGHGFLIDQHVAHHVKCASCHAENPPAKASETATCVSCHQDIVSSKDPQPNPHHAHSGHLGDIPCESCHHVHKESVVACNTCHNFDMKAP